MTSPIRSALSSDKPRFVGEWVRLGELVSIKQASSMQMLLMKMESTRSLLVLKTL